MQSEKTYASLHGIEKNNTVVQAYKNIRQMYDNEAVSEETRQQLLFIFNLQMFA